MMVQNPCNGIERTLPGSSVSLEHRIHAMELKATRKLGIMIALRLELNPCNGIERVLEDSEGTSAISSQESMQWR
jgi:hypothetical protein